MAAPAAERPAARLGLLVHPKGAFELATVASAGAADPRKAERVATLPDGDAFAYSADGARLALAVPGGAQIFNR